MVIEKDLILWFLHPFPILKQTFPLCGAATITLSHILCSSNLLWEQIVAHWPSSLSADYWINNVPTRELKHSDHRCCHLYLHTHTHRQAFKLHEHDRDCCQGNPYSQKLSSFIKGWWETRILGWMQYTVHRKYIACKTLKHVQRSLWLWRYF